MIELKPELQAIIWDFDGVILNSNKVRDQGFVEVLNDYSPDEVGQLLAFHQANGGLSRYVKFEYFFKEVVKQPYTEQDVLTLAQRFSVIMKELLTDKALLIEETLTFIQSHYHTLPMHIISGSDGEELRFLCQHLDISGYFRSIAGSPIPKLENLQRLIIQENYVASQLVLVGDSINDYEAAKFNDVPFQAYNNPALKHLTNY